MASTLSDIAKDTKTSVSTVSRVLSGGKAASRISEETRQRVTEAATRLGYRPNLIARSLRTRQSFTIALLVSDIANPWFSTLGYHIEQSLHRYGYSLMLCNSGEDLPTEIEYLKMLPQKGIDGLIVVPMTRTKKQFMEYLPASLPLVLLDRPIPGISSAVSSDQEQSAGTLCDALQRIGVKQIGLVAGPQYIVTHRRRAEIAFERFQVLMHHEGPAQKETGRQALIRFRGQGILPRALICTNNFLGQGILDGLLEVETPPIIATFDEIPMMNLLPMPIVASVQDVPLLAESCVNQLMAQLNHTKTEIKPIVLPTHIMANRAFSALVAE